MKNKKAATIYVMIAVILVGVGTMLLVSAEDKVETLSPIVIKLSADQTTIPEDTDDDPLWGEMATVDVTVDSNISTVSADLSSMPGGHAMKYLSNAGNYSDGTFWCVFNVTNASVGSAIWNATSHTYEPYFIPLNATDTDSNSNTSVNLEIVVMKNGDVSGNGLVTLYDASYVSKWYIGTEGFETIPESVADVSGNGLVTLYDASYISKWYIGTEGFEVLK